MTVIPTNASVAVLTGAGISVPSGLAPFRGPGGMWNDIDVEQYVTSDAFLRNREKVLGFLSSMRRTARAATPNEAHLALARADLLRPVILYLTNSHAKKVIIGDGRADVGAVRVFVRRAFPQLPWPEKWASKKNKYDDIADAAIIWACYAVEHYRADLSKLRIPPQSL